MTHHGAATTQPATTEFSHRATVPSASRPSSNSSNRSMEPRSNAYPRLRQGNRQQQPAKQHKAAVVLLLILGAVGVQVVLSSVAWTDRRFLRNSDSSGQEMRREAPQLRPSPHFELTLDDLLNAMGIRPRPYGPWKPQHPLPCDALDSGWNAAEPEKVNLTAKGIWFLQLNRTVPPVEKRSVVWRVETSPTANASSLWPICQIWIHNAPAYKRIYQRRDPSKSFLWSLVSDPTTLHHHNGATASSSTNGTHTAAVPMSQVQQLSLYDLRNLTLNPTLRLPPKSGLLAQPPEHRQWMQAIRTILQSYNFLGVAERPDESLVALQLLLGLDAPTVLFLSEQRTLTELEKDQLSVYLPNAVVARNPKDAPPDLYDRLLHRVAHRSLDLTIEALGPERFADALQRYRSLRKRVVARCARWSGRPSACVNEHVRLLVP